MTDLERFLDAHGASKKQQPSTARKGGSSTMSDTKTVIKKPKRMPKGHSKPKPSTPSGSGFPVYFGGGGKPKAASPGKRKSGLYKGKITPRRVQLRKVGSLGGGFSMPGIEKFIKPGLLVTAGALAFKTLDKLFLNDFLEADKIKKVDKDKWGVMCRYSEEFKTGIALATGLGVAGFSKNQNVKLVGLGVAVAQLVDYGAEKIVNGLTTSVKATKDDSPSSASSSKGMGGLLRVGNPFQIGSGLAMSRAGGSLPSVPSPADPDSVIGSSSGSQFAV